MRVVARHIGRAGRQNDGVSVGEAQVVERDLAALAGRGEDVRGLRLHAHTEHGVLVQEHVTDAARLHVVHDQLVVVAAREQLAVPVAPGQREDVAVVARVQLCRRRPLAAQHVAAGAPNEHALVVASLIN